MITSIHLQSEHVDSWHLSRAGREVEWMTSGVASGYYQLSAVAGASDRSLHGFGDVGFTYRLE